MTGYAGYEHILATDQAAFNAALIGTGQFVLEKGNIFEAQVQTNNLVRVRDGELMMQGRFVRMEPGNYVDLVIDSGTQGMKRNDLIVARYEKAVSTGVEQCNLVVIKGTASASNPTDPAHKEADITNGVGTIHDYPLWRIPIDGINVGEPESLFGLPFKDSMHTLHTIRMDVNEQLADYDEEMTNRLSKLEGYTKSEVISDATKAMFGKGASALPDDVFSLLGEFGAQVATGYYTGNGEFGSKYPTNIEFGFEPCLVLVSKAKRSVHKDAHILCYEFFVWIKGVTEDVLPAGDAYGNGQRLYVQNGNNLSWYVSNTKYSAAQFNNNGEKYFYFAIGKIAK